MVATVGLKPHKSIIDNMRYRVVLSLYVKKIEVNYVGGLEGGENTTLIALVTLINPRLTVFCILLAPSHSQQSSVDATLHPPWQEGSLSSCFGSA